MNDDDIVREGLSKAAEVIGSYLDDTQDFETKDWLLRAFNAVIEAERIMNKRKDENED